MSETQQHKHTERVRKKSKQKPNTHSRRGFLGLSKNAAIATGAIGVTGIAGTAWFGYLKERSEVAQKINEYTKSETILEPVIQRFEEGFEAFTQEVERKLEPLRLSPKDKSDVLIPFTLARINKDNSEKNYYRLARKSLETQGTLRTASVFTNNANHFHYEISNEVDKASFYNPLRKSFGIPVIYYAGNKLDNLIAVHELIHVAQDNSDRAELTSSAYKAFYDNPRTKSASVAIYEATAYAREIFFLDLLTDGQLKQDVAGKNLDAKKYLRLLSARPEQERIINLLLDMANVYFNGKSSLMGIDSRFFDYIANLYRSNGAEIYDRTPSGFVRIK